MTKDSEKEIITTRKEDHVNICLSEDVKAHYNFWNDIHFEHQALPELNFSNIDTRTKIFGKELSAPIIISAITGGYPAAEKINENLATAAARFGLGMGVGSQRAALENGNRSKTYSVIKQYDLPLVIGNIGAPQLIPQNGSEAMDAGKVEEAFEMIGADCLAVHLNFLQEIVQPEGNVNARGCMAAIKMLAFRYPIIAKETGSGISRNTAMALRHVGVKGIDVGGVSGTSFSAVEVYRAKNIEDGLRERLGRTFWDWGVPTPVSVITANVGLDIIATGGIRSGLDVARSLALGAKSAGMARALLSAATHSAERVQDELSAIIHELKATMFLTGSKNIEELRSKNVVVTGRTKEWIEQIMEQ